MLNHPLLWLLHANMAAPKLCFKESWEFFIFPWHDSHVFAKKNHHRPADGHQKFNSTKIMGGNPQVVSSTPPKDIHPTIPHPPTLHVDPSSPSILDLGCSKSGALQRWHLRVWRFTLPRIDVAQPNKLLLWRGLALFLKQSTGLIEKKKTSNSLKQCVVQNLKRTAWFKGNPSQKCRESFTRENMRLKLWRTVVQIGEWWTHVTRSLRILIFMAHGFQSSPTAFIRPCQLPAIKQICSFKKPSSARIEVIRENSPEKKYSKKTFYSEVEWGLFEIVCPNISTLERDSRPNILPSTYHHLTMQQFLCVQCFVGPLSLISQIHPGKSEPIVQPFSHPLYSSWIQLPVQLA